MEIIWKIGPITWKLFKKSVTLNGNYLKNRPDYLEIILKIGPIKWKFFQKSARLSWNTLYICFPSCRHNGDLFEIVARRSACTVARRHFLFDYLALLETKQITDST